MSDKLPFYFLCSHVEPCLCELQGTSFSLNGIPEFFHFPRLGRHLGLSLSESLIQTDQTVVQQVQLFSQVTVAFLPLFDLSRGKFNIQKEYFFFHQKH